MIDIPKVGSGEAINAHILIAISRTMRIGLHSVTTVPQQMRPLSSGGVLFPASKKRVLRCCVQFEVVARLSVSWMGNLLGTLCSTSHMHATVPALGGMQVRDHAATDRGEASRAATRAHSRPSGAMERKEATPFCRSC